MSEVKFSQERWQGVHSGELSIDDANKLILELRTALKEKDGQCADLAYKNMLLQLRIKQIET